jgi:hypothetical protein
MSLAFTLIGSSPNRVMYKVTSNSGEDGTLPNQGGVSPDLTTDTAAGTPIGQFVRSLVANDTAAENLFVYNINAKCRITGTTPTTAAKTPAWGVTATRNLTSGKADVYVRAATSLADAGGVLEIEVFHTIAK